VAQANLVREMDQSVLNEENLITLKHLEVQRDNMLLDEELDGKIKSRATWLEVRNQNTKKFQNIVNHRKNRNTIWEMIGVDGNRVRSFKELDALGVNHFKILFEELVEANIGEILKLFSFFPRSITKEENEIFYRAINKDELYNVLS
jgi:hypothetical protein